MRIEMADPFSQKNARDKAAQDKLIWEKNAKDQQADHTLEARNRIKQRELQSVLDKPYPWPKKFYHP